MKPTATERRLSKLVDVLIEYHRTDFAASTTRYWNDWVKRRGAAAKALLDDPRCAPPIKIRTRMYLQHLVKTSEARKRSRA